MREWHAVLIQLTNLTGRGNTIVKKILSKHRSDQKNITFLDLSVSFASPCEGSSMSAYLFHVQIQKAPFCRHSSQTPLQSWACRNNKPLLCFRSAAFLHHALPLQWVFALRHLLPVKYLLHTLQNRFLLPWLFRSVHLNLLPPFSLSRRWKTMTSQDLIPVFCSFDLPLIFYHFFLWRGAVGPFIWVAETTLPPSYPGRANFSLISLQNSTNY